MYWRGVMVELVFLLLFGQYLTSAATSKTNADCAFVSLDTMELNSEEMILLLFNA
jgi:hypothetical protein